jgi:hypothetical protein
MVQLRETLNRGKFSKLPNPDKQFVKLRGIVHVAVLGKNRHRVWQVMASFLTLPGVAGA